MKIKHDSLFAYLLVRPLGERRFDMRHAFMVWKMLQDGLLALVAQIIKVAMYRVMTVAARTFRVGICVELASIVGFLREVFDFAHYLRCQRYGLEQVVSGLICCHKSWSNKALQATPVGRSSMIVKVSGCWLRSGPGWLSLIRSASLPRRW